MAHVNPTPNLRKLDAKSSWTEDRNNANVVSKDTYRNVIKAFRILPQPIDSLQPLKDDILANVIHINSQIS